MRALASFIMRGRTQATMVTVGMAALSLLPLLNWLSLFSAAAVGLVTLRNGPREGLIVTVMATLIVALIAYLSQQVTSLALGMAVLFVLVWLPVWGLAVLLRASISLSLTVTVAGVVAAMAVIVAHVVLGDASAWWRQILAVTVEETMGASFDVPVEDLAKVLDTLAGLMTGIVGAGLALSFILSVFLARWWQAMLYNPGGFGKEVQALRLRRVVAGVCMVVLALGMFASGFIGEVATDLSMVTVALYALPGIGLVHAVVSLMGAHAAWLIVMYVLLLLLPVQLMTVLAAGGMVDSWIDVRAKLTIARAGRGGPGPTQQG